MADRRWISRIGAGLVFGWLALLSATAFGQEPGNKGLPPLPPSVPIDAGPSNPVFVQDQPADMVLQEQPGPVRGLVQRMWGYVDPDNAEIISMHQLACLIDHLDKSLFCRGQVVVKNPDVWGQNRLTEHRVEYENQMQAQINNFEVVLSSYQRRAGSGRAHERDLRRGFGRAGRKRHPDTLGGRPPGTERARGQRQHADRDHVAPAHAE